MNPALEAVADFKADEIIPSSLVEPAEGNVLEEEKKEEVKLEEGQAPNENQAQASVPLLEDVPMTFGFPDSLLRDNDIDPAMLYEFPAEVRVEILSTIQDQLDEWHQSRAALQASNVGGAAAEQVQPEQPQPAEEQNLQPEAQPMEGSSLVEVMAGVEEPGAGSLPAAGQGQVQPEAGVPEAQQPQPAQPGAEQPQPAQAQPVPAAELDPEVRQAIEMGLDPDFIAHIPPELRRELIQNEQFRAINTGAPAQPAAPQRAPEAMDVASIIATVDNPSLRREMLANLSQEQIDGLPPALRNEALNFRRGRDPAGELGGLFRNAPPGHLYRGARHGHAPLGGRHQLNYEAQLMQHFRRRERDLDFGAYLPGVGAHKKVLPDPKGLPFDQILVDNCQEEDQKMQDELLNGEKTVRAQILEEVLESDADEASKDEMLLNIIKTLCLCTNVRTDLVQFLRLVLKQKSETSNAGYQCRNKILNTLTYVLKLTSTKDKERLFDLLGLGAAAERVAKFEIDDFQWNKLFLLVVGILRSLIDNNKKLIFHMLKCLIQKDEYFLNKGDHVIAGHARALAAEPDSKLKPPLADII